MAELLPLIISKIFNFFFVQHKFYFTFLLVSFSGLWSPPKKSPLSMEKFSPRGGGGGGEGN